MPFKYGQDHVRVGDAFKADVFLRLFDHAPGGRVTRLEGKLDRIPAKETSLL